MKQYVKYFIISVIIIGFFQSLIQKTPLEKQQEQLLNSYENSALMEQAKNASKSGDYMKAFEISEKLCSKGVPDGCALLATFHNANGDNFKALEVAEKACDKNSSIGCDLLGKLYEEGGGVKQDFKKAKEFYGKACDLKYNDGCESYKKLNERGY